MKSDSGCRRDFLSCERVECVWWFGKAVLHFRSVGCREDEDGGGGRTTESERGRQGDGIYVGMRVWVTFG